MTDMDILLEMLKENAREDLQYDEQEKQWVTTLRERGVKGSDVIIRNLPHDALVIKVDAFRQPDTVFNGHNSECCRADYAIISAEKKCIIYIEMKRTKDEWHKIVAQLKGAQCFIVYCQEVGKLFWGDSNFLGNYKKRFISIRHTSSRKKKTRSSRDQIKYNVPDTPDEARKISKSNDLQINHIAWLGAK